MSEQLTTPHQWKAYLDSVTYAEWLPPDAELIGCRYRQPHDRGEPEDWMADGWRWLQNVPKGPHPDGQAVIEQALVMYGPENVRTGNSAHPDLGEPHPTKAPNEYNEGLSVGVYVKDANG